MRYNGPENQPPIRQFPQPTAPRRSPVLWVLAGLLALLMLTCGILTVTAFGRDANDGAEVITTSTTPDPPATSKAKAAAPKAQPEAVRISEGGYIVGEDVPAGRYRTAGARKEVLTLCYWEVRTNGEPDGPIGQQGAVDAVDQPSDVTLSKGDYFKTTGCKPWAKR